MVPPVANAIQDNEIILETVVNTKCRNGVDITLSPVKTYQIFKLSRPRYLNL